MNLRWLDFSRWCRWTAYSAGARQARLMDVPYPTAVSGTAYTVITSTESGGADVERPDRTSETFETTPYEALLLQHGEFEITKALRKWNRQRHALIADVYSAAVQTRHLWPEWCEWRRRLKAAMYRRSAAWSPFFLLPARAVLAVCEFPLTHAAMKSFRLEPFDTQVAAAGAAVGLVYLSHLVGHRLRERRWGSLATVCVGVAAASLLSLAVLRSDFLEHVASDRAEKTEVAIAKAGIAPSAVSLPTRKEKPIQNKAILLTLMVLFFVTGVVLAHESHEPDHEIREIAKNKPRADRRFGRKFKRFSRAAAAHDHARDDAHLRVTEEKERTLLSVREWRFANGLWRGASVEQPTTFAESVDERFFKPRDLGPRLLPTVRELERLFSEGDQVGVDNLLARLFAEMRQEPTYEI